MISERVMGAVLVVAGMFASLATPAAAQGLYSISELAVPPGTDGCSPAAINAAGDIAGSCAPETAVMWRGGRATVLGRLPGGQSSTAHAINAQGVIVGEGDTGDFRPQAVLFRNGTPLNIDPDGGANLRAIGVSDRGVIVGNYAKGLSGNTSSGRGVIWTERPARPGRFDMVTLPVVPGGTTKSVSNYATASNNAVQVVGWVTSSVFGQRGGFWNNDAIHSVVTLDPLPGDWTSIAWGINDLGQAVGESHPPFRTRAVLWADDATHTAVDLGALPGDNNSVATGINAAGQIIGSSYASAPNSWTVVGLVRAVIWRNGQVDALESLLDASGADWSITQATALNDAGQIVGIGMKSGRPAAFIMTPLAH